MKILLLAVFLFSSPAIAASKHINLLRNYSLSPSGNGSFGLSLFFEETAPGRVSDKVDAFGCSLVMRSAGNFVFTGRYRVDLEEESVVDGVWRKQYTNWGRGSDTRVTCRSDQPISEDYVNKVLAGFARVEK